LRAEAKDYLVAEGLAVPKPPLWGKDNDPTEWWNINDFEILSACYRHEVEMFLKIVAPYFPELKDWIVTDFQNYAPLPENQRHQVQ